MLELNNQEKKRNRIKTALEWLKSSGKIYFPVFAILILFIISICVGLSYSIILMLGLSTILMAVGVFFLKLQKHDLGLLPDSQIMSPSFIVLSSGEIKSSNKLGVDYVLNANGRLQNLLDQDGFDDGAAYRLLNVTNSETIIENHNQLTYKSRKLDNEMSLIIRYQEMNYSGKTSIDKPDINLDDDTFNDLEVDIEEDIDSFFDSLPFGYFEKQQNKEITPVTGRNDMFAMNKTLRDWVDSDQELLNHIEKFGSDTSKRSMGIRSSKTLKHHSLDKNGDDILKVFQVLMSDDSYGETSRIQGFVLPMPSSNTDHEALAIEDDLPTKIFKNAPTPTVIIDDKDLIIDYNQAFLNLIEIFELSHKSIRDYFPESERSKFNVTLESDYIEIAMDKPKERILSLKICFSEMQGYKICYFNDISTQKSLEQKFNQAQKMQAIGQLAGGVAHDFNNLLTAIGGHTELLMNRFSPADLTYADLLHIRNNVNRAGNLVRQLLAFSRRQTLTPEIITLTDILPDLSRMLERLVGDRITLETNYAPSLKAIKADITQLEQVIINLGVNARDAMKNDGGTLTIKTENIIATQALEQGHDIMPAADYVKITVSDTGHGMAENVREKIFEPFFTTKPQGEGTGLGLSTVYGIVKQSGGFIFVDSEVNKGTDFRIYFPITNDISKKTLQIEAVKDHGAEQIVAAPHTKTILIVEDEESVRSFVVRALELKGYQVLEADCGEDALALFKEHYKKINLIITDVMMPGLSGPEWIKQAQEIKKQFSVVFMSGYTQDYFRDDDAFALPDLETAFLSKPFSLKVLNEVVKSNI